MCLYVCIYYFSSIVYCSHNLYWQTGQTSGHSKHLIGQRLRTSHLCIIKKVDISNCLRRPYSPKSVRFIRLYKTNKELDGVTSVGLKMSIGLNPRLEILFAVSGPESSAWTLSPIPYIKKCNKCTVSQCWSGARLCRIRKLNSSSACLMATSQWGLVEKTEHTHSSNGGFRLECMRRKPKPCVDKRGGGAGEWDWWGNQNGKKTFQKDHHRLHTDRLG